MKLANCLAVLAMLQLAMGVSAQAAAEEVSAREPDFLLACNEVFDGNQISSSYVETIVDYAMPRVTRPKASKAAALGADPDAADRLSKWAGNPRMIVRSDIPISRTSFTVLDTILFSWSKLDIEYVWDNDARVTLRDGDLLVYVSLGPVWLEGKHANARLSEYLREFYGSESNAQEAIDSGRWNDRPLGFIDVIRNPDNSIARAMVAVSFMSLQAQGDNWLFELMTSALNPNPGNAAYSGFPGATSEEKRIYDRVWYSATQYGLVWGKEFQAFMAVLYDGRVKPGMSRGQLVEAATEVLNRPRIKDQIFVAHNCKNDM